MLNYSKVTEKLTWKCPYRNRRDGLGLFENHDDSFGSHNCKQRLLVSSCLSACNFSTSTGRVFMKF